MKGFFKFGLPLIKLVIKDKKIDALLDTGFNGQVMLPQKLIEELELEQIGLSDYMTASGESRVTQVYRSIVKLIDDEVEVIILSTDAGFSLAGIELFHEYKIVIERYKNLVEVEKKL